MTNSSLPQFSGKIILIKLYTRQLIRSMPDTLFVFGDNIARVGYGGQAAAARGELNSVGIPTKMSPQNFFLDTPDHFELAKERIAQSFVILAQHLKAGKNVIWPLDGVGTGLAELEVRAPRIWNGLEDCRKALFSMANEVIRYE